MNKLNITCKCGKTYKTQKWYEKHLREETCKNQDIKRPIIIKNTRRVKIKISSAMRFNIWKKYIGDTIEGECLCCYKNKITPFTNHNTFHAGHIISEKNGGKITIDNLLPICRDCNTNMFITHWDDYVQYNNLPIRVHGANIPPKHILAAKTLQIFYNTFIKKKKKKRKKRKKKLGYMKHTQSSLNKLK